MGILDGSLTTDALVVISLQGEHDTYEAERLAHALASVLSEAADERPIVIDLAEATFIDSTVISVVLRALKEAERSERTLLIHLPPTAGKYVHTLLETTGLHTILPIVPSWDLALARANLAQTADGNPPKPTPPANA